MRLLVFRFSATPVPKSRCNQELRLFLACNKGLLNNNIFKSHRVLLPRKHHNMAQ